MKAIGEVVSSSVVPNQHSPWLELTVDDGSGSFVVMYTGRRAIAGLEPGRLVEFEGVLRVDRSRRVMLNPAYTLIAE